MATISTLARQKDGSFSGTLILPSLNGAKIRFAPVEKQSDKGPAYRISIGGFKGWQSVHFRKTQRTELSRRQHLPVLVKSDTARHLEWNPPPRKSPNPRNPRRTCRLFAQTSAELPEASYQRRLRLDRGPHRE